MRLNFAFVAAAVLIGSIAALAHGAKYPEPSVYPIAWQLDFKQGTPTRIVVATEAYWYLTYTVTNKSGQDQVWQPDFQMVSDDGKVIRSDKGIGADVFDTIKAREANRFLRSASEVAGDLRQGEDQAKDGVAIWKEPARRMGKFKIFVAGLSGEFAILKGDDGKPIPGDDKLPLILHKTLELDYAIYGDEHFPGRNEVHETGHKWIMR